MAKNTNFSNMKELLGKYEPAFRGFATDDEVKLITEALELESMSVLELRNLRDFSVLYFDRLKDGVKEGESGHSEETLVLMDKMSAVTAVIDANISRLGGEV